jgi:HSP20 family protein
MSFWNIEPEDWFRRERRSFGGRRDDIFGQFDEMRREVERMFEHQFKDIETKAPKDLVREYETPEGGKVREMGPFVYGYSMTIGHSTTEVRLHSLDAQRQPVHNLKAIFILSISLHPA